MQELKSELIGLQRQEAQLAEKLGDRHPTLIKSREGVRNAEARLRAEMTKASESVRREYQAAKAAESSLGHALESQRKEMLSLNRSERRAGCTSSVTWRAIVKSTTACFSA